MSNFENLSTDAQTILENSRKEFLADRMERIETLQKEAATAAIVGVAREVAMLYPEIRYVKIQRPGKKGGLRILKVSEVLDEDRNLISDHSNRTLSWKVEDLLLRANIHQYVAFEPGEYDFKVLANRQF